MSQRTKGGNLVGSSLKNDISARIRKDTYLEVAVGKINIWFVKKYLYQPVIRTML